MIKPKFGLYKAKVLKVDEELRIKMVIEEYKWVNKQTISQLYFNYRDEPNITVIAERMIF